MSVRRRRLRAKEGKNMHLVRRAEENICKVRKENDQKRKCVDKIFLFGIMALIFAGAAQSARGRTAKRRNAPEKIICRLVTKTKKI